ncbi:hypothetical protein KIN20_009542 [Parelaphostrongylus tenuis]|uniref:Uncharacterized protein n=1 Tax=Parelaphostrongylus tenuis TaxID=148309 RepID=A0AAD5MQR1_PARTN|nr:hypothetical protein KIN20_009542 [Parelaphostrongylus tenuis]
MATLAHRPQKLLNSVCSSALCAISNHSRAGTYFLNFRRGCLVNSTKPKKKSTVHEMEDHSEEIPDATSIKTMHGFQLHRQLLSFI